MTAPKTTRMRAHFCAGALAYFDDDGETPVLVVSEATVKGCKHANVGMDAMCQCWCAQCGSHFHNGKWTRPRILRVGQVSALDENSGHNEQYSDEVSSRAMGLLFSYLLWSVFSLMLLMPFALWSFEYFFDNRL